MKNKLIFLIVLLNFNMAIYSINLSFLGNLNPFLSYGSQIVCNYVKNHKVVSGAAVVATACMAVPKLRRAVFSCKDVFLRATFGAALRSGLACAVRYYLAQGFDLNAPMDHMNRTALHIAAENGSESVVSELVRAGADIDARDSYGNTPLYCAVNNGHAGTVARLVALGADQSIADKAGRAPMHIAAEKGYADVIRALASNEKSNLNLVCFMGTPLHCATIAGQGDAIRTLVDLGASLEVLYQGKTPLVTAILQDDLEKFIVALPGIKAQQYAHGRSLVYNQMAQILIEKGADVNVVFKGEGALLQAARKGRTDIFKMLYENQRIWRGVMNSQGEDARAVAFGAGRREIVQYIDDWRR
jgi:ankyrin repeat protein